MVFLQASPGAEGHQRRSNIGKAVAAGVIGVAILSVVMVMRFAVVEPKASVSNSLATAPPGTYQDDFTNKDANEQGRVCEILSAVLTPEHSSSATTKYVRLPNGRLVSRLFEPSFGSSASSFKATLTSTSSTSAGSKLIEDSSVVFTHNSETKTTTLDVEAPIGFSVVQVGAIVTDTSDGLQSSFLDPQPTDPNDFFYVYVGKENGRTLSLRDVKSFVLSKTDGEKSRLCGTANAEQIDPKSDSRCGGPYYIYSYAKVCKDGSVATTETLIDIVFTNTVTTATRLAFEEARDTWNGIVKNTFPEAVLNSGQTTIKCNGRTLTFPSGTRMLSGLMIFAMVHSIDGDGGILAQAGPCAYSDGQYGFLLPRVGLMEFDIADVQRLQQSGSLAAVVQHEMAHVLGVGVHWEDVGILKNKGTSDPRYTGENGVKGYKSLDGANDVDIPVANTGGAGTAGGHWRESVFGDELMTGYSSGANTLSIVTIRSLQDLGFLVDVTKAEEYVLPGSSSFGSGAVAASVKTSMAVSKLKTLEATPALEGDTFGSENLLKLDLASQVEVDQENEPDATAATPTKSPVASPTKKETDDDDDDDDDNKNKDDQGGQRRLRKQKRVSSVVMQQQQLIAKTVKWSGVLPLSE